MSPHIYKQVASSNNHHEQDKDKTNRDGGVDNLDVRLLDEDLARLEAELLDLLLRDGLAPQQLLDLTAIARRVSRHKVCRQLLLFGVVL